jgi:hypothetical protein
MPDITMCMGLKFDNFSALCPKRLFCHRYTATPTPNRQSYYRDAPFDLVTKECDHFWENERGKKNEHTKRKKRNGTGSGTGE